MYVYMCVCVGVGFMAEAESAVDIFLRTMFPCVQCIKTAWISR